MLNDTLDKACNCGKWGARTNKHTHTLMNDVSFIALQCPVFLLLLLLFPPLLTISDWYLVDRIGVHYERRNS